MIKKLLLLLSSLTLLSAEQLLDQSLGIVGKRVLTIQDVACDAFVVAALEKHQLIHPAEIRKNKEELDKARLRLMQTVLIRNYLTTTGLMAQVTTHEIDSLKSSIQNVLGAKNALRSFLVKQELSEEDFARSLTDYAMRQQFLKDYLTVRTPITNDMLAAYYESEKDAKFLGKPLASVEKLVRESLRRRLQEQELETWTQTEMKRTEVVLLPIPDSPQ